MKQRVYTDTSVIDRIVTPDAFQVHNVLEVPTDQDMDTTNRGDGDMLSVDLFSRA